MVLKNYTKILVLIGLMVVAPAVAMDGSANESNDNNLEKQILDAQIAEANKKIERLEQETAQNLTNLERSSQNLTNKLNTLETDTENLKNEIAAKNQSKVLPVIKTENENSALDESDATAERKTIALAVTLFLGAAALEICSQELTYLCDLGVEQIGKLASYTKNKIFPAKKTKNIRLIQMSKTVNEY